MGRLFIPAESSIEGPWLLGSEELEQLDNLVKYTAQKLEEAYKRKCKDYDQQLQSLITVRVTLTSSDNKKLEDSSIIGILKDVKSKDFSPTELYIKIENIPNENEFRLVATSGYEGKLEYQLKCFSEEYELDVKYELDKWIDKFKPKKIVQYWLSFTPLIWIIGLITILVLFFSLYDTSTDYDTQINRQAFKLIETGIDSSNVNEAVSILLKKQIKYSPENFKTIETFNYDSLKNLIRVILIFTCLVLCPVSVIGVGKRIWKVSFYKFSLKIIIGLIPTAILLPKLIDIINKYLF